MKEAEAVEATPALENAAATMAISRRRVMGPSSGLEGGLRNVGHHQHRHVHRWPASRTGIKCVREVAARGDLELLVGVVQVRLDGAHGHEEGLGDLLVGHAA